MSRKWTTASDTNQWPLGLARGGDPSLVEGGEMKKAPSPTKAEPSAPNSRKFSQKSNGTEAQYARILAALRRGPQTSYALRLLGCYQAPARIKELRDKFGFNIETELVTLYDHEGYMHPRAARYHLHGEVPQ